MARLTDEQAAEVDAMPYWDYAVRGCAFHIRLRILDLLGRVATLEAERDAAQADCKAMAGALGALRSCVEDLVSESAGVAGLHRNGDLAPWGTLTDGGQHEDWLPIARICDPADDAVRRWR
jgi:hypothetical protein